ncbi:MAG: hypothetical protein J1D88_08075 [Treponema sp.]|nr:hypothetical protein [Treponema sp.]
MKKLIALFSVLVLLGAAAFARPAKSKGSKTDKTSGNSNVTVDDSKGKTAPAKPAKSKSRKADKTPGSSNVTVDDSKDSIAVPETVNTTSGHLKESSIAVPAPKGVNLEDGADWIPLFIQGVITSNFQQYSGLTVIDRQNADMVKAEQKLSESAEFDEKNTLELGKMTSARFIVTGSIMAKSASYALTFSITDAETGETKATANVPNCLRSALEDGTAANKISYDLMEGYGIALGDDAKKNLTQKATVMAAATSAQVSVAKGIIAEQSGSNIEAFTYYIQAKKNDRNLAEATSRMAGMTSVMAGGNFGASAKNMMKLHDDWEKLLLEAAGLIAANPPEFEVRYFTDIEPLELTEKDYANKTMSFRMGAPYLMQTSGEENLVIAEELMDAMRKIPESKNWGKKMNGFPWTYANDIPGDHWLKWVNTKKVKSFPLTVVLLDANKNPIARRPYTLYVNYAKDEITIEIRNRNPASLSLWEKISFGDKSPRGYEYFTISSDNKDAKNNSLPSLTISGVPVGNADTDKIYISVENAGNQKISVLPTDALPADKAESVVKAGSHNGTVKVGGFWKYARELNKFEKEHSVLWHDFYDYRYLSDYFDSSTKFFALDLSECVNVTYFSFERCPRLIGIKLPKGTRVIVGDVFSSCTGPEIIIIPESVIAIKSGMPTTSPNILYAGSKKQWHKIYDSDKFLPLVKGYNYNPQEADGSSDGKDKEKK